MSLFSSKKQPIISLVFDIRDSSFTLAAAKFEKDEKPELIYCQNFAIPVQDISDYSKYQSVMLAALDQAVVTVRKILVKMGNRESIKNHFFFIGSPWSVSQAKLIKVTKDRPFEVNNAFLKKIIITEETEAEKQIAQASGEHPWEVFEEKIVQSKLNGYVIEKIFGKRTVDLEVEMFVSFIPSEVKNKIHMFENAKLGGMLPKHVHSSTLSSYSFLRDVYPQLNNFIYVDAGDFLTDTYIVKDGIISMAGSIPTGTRDIMQSVLKKGETSEHLLASAVAIHRDGNYDLALKKDFEKNINAAITIWSDKLQGLISGACTESDLPTRLFIAPRNEISYFVADEIAGKKGNVLKIFGIEMEIETIGEQAFDDHITNGKAYPNEPGIKMDVTFLAKIIGQDGI